MLHLIRKEDVTNVKKKKGKKRAKRDPQIRAVMNRRQMCRVVDKRTREQIRLMRVPIDSTRKICEKCSSAAREGGSEGGSVISVQPLLRRTRRVIVVLRDGTTLRTSCLHTAGWTSPVVQPSLFTISTN